MQRLLMIGMNHTSAPLAIREKCAFPGARREQALREFRRQFPDAEAVLISTCNRVELYTSRAVHSHPRLEEMIRFFAQAAGIAEAELRPHLYNNAHRAVAEHLFEVAASLNSMVVGETQILGQVRDAYELAGHVDTVGALLHPMFQRAIATAREVLNTTGLGEGRRSIASIAVDYARQVFEEFSDKTVLSIGAGKMSSLVLQHFAELRVRKLIVCNREITKAQTLAERFGGIAQSIDDLPQLLAEADIIVSSTSSPVPIITRQRFEAAMKKRRWKPVFMVDIALPRDIEPAVGAMDNVYLYNIDDLQQVAAATDCSRRDSVELARNLVHRRVNEFVTWHLARESGPLIEKLFEKSHAIAHEEAQRTIRKLSGISDLEKEHLEELARRIVNKLLHDPVHAVRQGGIGGASYVYAMEKLFRLDEQKAEAIAKPEI